MNRQNKQLLLKMKKLQYYDFLRYALGMKYYLLNDGLEVRTRFDEDGTEEEKSVTRNETNDRFRVLAYLYSRGKRVKTFLIWKYDFEEKVFHDDFGEIYDVETFFENVDSFLLWAIIMGVLGIERFSKVEIDFQYDFGKRFFERYKPEQYRFILGAGVNSNLDIGDWSKLID